MDAKVFNNQHIETFRRWVEEAHHIVLLSHMNADGDACGSVLGLAKQLDFAAPAAKNITPILPNGCPRTFTWLPGSERILSGETQLELCLQKIAEADLLICMDLNTASRTDFLQDAILEAKCHKVLIDHHKNPATDQFDIIFSDDISSTCELTLWVSQALWGKKYFNTDMARCLYTGLRTDTGGFAFSCDQPSCFEAAAILVSYDINPADIHNHIVNTFSFDRMRFYGFALSQRLRIYSEARTAILYFSLDDQKRFGVGGEDMEGLVNYTLMMTDIEVGVLLREESNRTKVSFRSKYNVDVNLLAQKLGGGGHTKAAGATCVMSFDEALAQSEKLLGIHGLEPLKFNETHEK